MPIQEELARSWVRYPEEKLISYLCNSGAEANENALKLASFHTGRKKIIAFSKSFHGRTSLAVAATDNPAIVAPVNQTENIIFLPFNDEDSLEACFRAQGSDVAAVIVEGIQGVGGINIAKESFLQKIRSLCTANNAVFIADSVQCGFGRTGKFFSHDHADVDADIYSMAKGMGNGFYCGHHHRATPATKIGMLGTTRWQPTCAQPHWQCWVIETEGLMQHAKIMGDHIQSELKKSQS